MENNTLPTNTPKKKKIVLITDDMRFPSGVGTMAKELVFNTIQKYDWINIGGCERHPEVGTIVDMSDYIKSQTGVQDANCKIYPVNGYGDENVILQILQLEKPDALMLFTDPRYFQHVFHIEKQIRSKIPIVYLSIWDSNPYPMWNQPFYNSCDTLLAITKQTDNIHEQVLNPENCIRLN